MIVDASVAIKWIVDEPGSDAAKALAGNRFFAPTVFPLECAGVLWKHVRKRTLSEDEGTLRLDTLLQRANVTLIDIDVPAAFRSSLRWGHPVYDCVYLLLAQSRGDVLATADEGLRQAAVRAGLASQVHFIDGSPASL